MRYFISAIGTDSGKTLVSAILVEAFKADYWKPVQAGLPRDTDTVISLVHNQESQFHQEAYVLKTPASPHAAASIDGVKLSTASIKMPETNRPLIIEGAGGLMVPLNAHEFMVDLPDQWKVPVILVANLYLGSINHTLLTIDCLKHRSVEVKGIIFNGESNPASEELILNYSGCKALLKIPRLEDVNKAIVRELAEQLLRNWNE